MSPRQIGKPPAGMPSLAIHSGDIALIGYNGAFDTQRLLVDSTPQQITAILSDRKVMRVMNLSDNDVYIGRTDGVGSGDGWPVFAQTWQDFPMGPDISPYIMLDGAGVTGDCRIMELE